MPYLTRINEKKAIDRKRLMLFTQQLFRVGNRTDALDSTLMEHKKFQLLGNNNNKKGLVHVMCANARAMMRLLNSNLSYSRKCNS